MKLYFIAGEDSGDLHSSNLMKALKGRKPELQLRGVGGDLMQAQGMELIAHVRDINFMGFWEVITHLRTIRRLFRKVKADIQDWQPDAVVLVDYPGFNLRMAPFLQDLGIPVFYYISPQVWAWKKGRVKKIRKFVDKMMVILPFEKAFYAKEGVEVEFVGHPLLDAIGDPEPPRPPAEAFTVALLPGSRKQEIRRMLPVMLKAAEAFLQAEFVIAGAPSQEEAFYRELIGQAPVSIRMNQTYELLQAADYAWVTSGTATLETALFQVPEVVLYRGGWLSYQIGKRLVRVDFISLVNLILGREAVRELIQGACTPASLIAAQQQLMAPEGAQKLAADYAELRQRLGAGGASQKAAQCLLEAMAERQRQA
jgi:lipid-A-disaccharide synthase